MSLRFVLLSAHAYAGNDASKKTSMHGEAHTRIHTRVSWLNKQCRTMRLVCCEGYEEVGQRFCELGVGGTAASSELSADVLHPRSAGGTVCAEVQASRANCHMLHRGSAWRRMAMSVTTLHERPPGWGEFCKDGCATTNSLSECVSGKNLN